MRERLADGRYGPVFLAHDPAADQVVVIRAFTETLDLVQRALLLDALQHACDLPLQHASIGRPLTCGLSGDHVYVVHTYLPGQQADQWVKAHGRRSIAELVLPLSGIAAAIDYAAAVRVHHGALTTSDLVIDGEVGGVTGWGIEQARAAAGLSQATPSHAGDIAALASAVFELLIPDDAARLRGVFERAWSSNSDVAPASALAFVASLQETLVASAPEPAAESELAIDDGPAVPELPFLQTFQEQPFDRGASLLGSPGEPAGFAPHHQPRRNWPAVAAVAVIMLAAGFAGGLFVGREQTPPVTPVPAAPVAAATTGQAFTDAPVVESGAPASAPQPANDQPPVLVAPPPPAATARPLETSPAVLQIDSRPQGAQVYVDGRLVGRTPLVASDVRPGPHIVRMQMPGHRQWSTAVTVAAGERARIGGSLEEIY